MQQTFIIKHWYGAPTYRDAIRSDKYDKDGRKVCDHDFDRVGVKRVDTALKYLKSWRRQAKEKGYVTLFATLLRNDARYEIVATPDGYHETEVVASGMMKDLD